MILWHTFPYWTNHTSGAAICGSMPHLAVLVKGAYDDSRNLLTVFADVADGTSVSPGLLGDGGEPTSLARM